MSKVVKEDINALNAVLTITLEKADYEAKFDTELGKYRKHANMRGFRKGKTPLSMLKKMYGKAVLADVINDLLQHELNDFLSRENLNILGQPLPSEDQEEIDFDLKNFRDYTFKFDLGLAPDFEVKGLSEDNTFGKYQVAISEEMIDEELENARKRHGQRVFPEEEIQENDLLKIAVREYEGDEIKEDGVENEFSLLVSSVDNEDLKADILSKKNGDVFRVNLFQLEKDVTDTYVRRYYLGLPEGDAREVGQEYEATIEEVSRIEPAELNEEFFQKYFGQDTDVDSEEKAREKIRESIAKYYDSQADALLFRDFQEDLMEKNQLDLPDDFLKRWLLATNENMTAADIDEHYEEFAKNLQWTLIRNKLVRENELQVEEDAIFEAFKKQISSYFGGSPVNEDLVISMADRMMTDEEQYRRMYDELLVDKLHEFIAGKVTVNPEPIEKESFEEILSEARAKAEAARQKQVAAADEEE